MAPPADILRVARALALAAALILAGWASGGRIDVPADHRISTSALAGSPRIHDTAQADAALTDHMALSGLSGAQDDSHHHVDLDVERQAGMPVRAGPHVRLASMERGAAEHPEFPPIRPPRDL